MKQVKVKAYGQEWKVLGYEWNNRHGLQLEKPHHLKELCGVYTREKDGRRSMIPRIRVENFEELPKTVKP